MPVFPAVKGGDMMVGVDIHKVYGVPVHPYNGTITVHNTPKFPVCNVTVNNMPACSIGASSVMPHVPQGTPIDPSNVLYGKKDKVNTKMAQELAKHRIDSKKTILNLKAIKLRDKSTEKFVQKTTGLSTKEDAGTWKKIQSDYSQSSKSNTWKVLKIPPVPYPGGQGCVIAGSSKVTVNGAPMAYVFPMNAASCTDLQNIPNASVMGTSNVLVGVTYADMMKAAKDNAVDEKKEFVLRLDMPEEMAKLSRAKAILKSDKGFLQQKTVAGDWKKKTDEYGDILFKDLPVSDDPEENPKYTLEIDYGCGGEPGIVFKDRVYGSWITEPTSVPIEQKDN